MQSALKNGEHLLNIINGCVGQGRFEEDLHFNTF